MCPFKTLPLPPPLPLPPLLPPTLMLPEVLPHAFPPPTNLPVCSFCRLLGPRALLGFDTQTVHTKGGFSLPLYLNTKISHVHRKGHQGCPVQDHFLFFFFCKGLSLQRLFLLVGPRQRLVSTSQSSIAFWACHPGFIKGMGFEGACQG